MRPTRFLLYEWIQRYKSKAKHNLTMSGIKKPDLAELGINLNYDSIVQQHEKDPQVLQRNLAETYGVANNHVLVTSSGSEALFLVMGSFAKAGDEVLVHLPNYPPIFQLPQMLGCSVKFLKSNLQSGFRINLRELRDTLRRRPKLLLLSNSHNPSGTVIETDVLTEVISMAKRCGTRVVVDEAFRDFAFENAPAVAATLNENVLSLNTMSKFYGMEGLRIGWVIGTPGLLDRIRLLKNMTTIENSGFGEALTALIMQNRKPFVDRARRFVASNHALMRDWIARRSDMKWVEPEGALFGFPRYNLPIPSTKLAQVLAEKFQILVAPGTFFGTERHLRICYTQSQEELEHALTALGEAFNEISKSH